MTMRRKLFWIRGCGRKVIKNAPQGRKGGSRRIFAMCNKTEVSRELAERRVLARGLVPIWVRASWALDSECRWLIGENSTSPATFSVALRHRPKCRVRAGELENTHARTRNGFLKTVQNTQQPGTQFDYQHFNSQLILPLSTPTEKCPPSLLESPTTGTRRRVEHRSFALNIPTRSSTRSFPLGAPSSLNLPQDFHSSLVSLFFLPHHSTNLPSANLSIIDRLPVLILRNKHSERRYFTPSVRQIIFVIL